MRNSCVEYVSCIYTICRYFAAYSRVLIMLDAPFIIHNLNPIIVTRETNGKQYEESGTQTVCKTYNINNVEFFSVFYKHTYANAHKRECIDVAAACRSDNIIYLSCWFNFSRDLCIVMMTIIGWSVFFFAVFIIVIVINKCSLIIARFFLIVTRRSHQIWKIYTYER